jgi:hypothetical protein
MELGKSDRSADASGAKITGSLLPSDKSAGVFNTSPKNAWRQVLQGWHSDSGVFVRLPVFNNGRAAFFNLIH